MRKSRFTEAQIIGILREQDGGGKTADVCRRHGVSEQTFYRWKSKYGGMDMSESKRLRALDQENAELKKLAPEFYLDKRALEASLKKNYGCPVSVVRR